ncbi:hypothetical protein BCR34DRAFT_597729 [Clohesyomyces aquaticus]|uniref:Uncharacterized protein n=1 Tax=Clohesyomyces aquaticus TaxID=1231657 RepID=A0A1Y2A1V2_9PLEO|nr:hypothetical protein BCR34DRAFT_597729 [Clohesyomyces aquaticus]
MSALLSTLLFVASASASITTSLVLPGGGPDQGVTYEGSVVGVNNAKTTMVINYANGTDPSLISQDGNPTETITLSGTSFAVAVTTTEDGKKGDMTVSLGCEFPTATTALPVCTYSYGGELWWSSFCSDYSDLATASDDAQPSYCLTGSTIPDSVAVTTITAEDRKSLGTVALVITAGEEKLGSAATTGAAATTSGPKPTGLNTVTGTGAAKTGASNAPSGTAASAGTSAGSTGAAVPLATMAPALMGLGAAVAAFF